MQSYSVEEITLKHPCSMLVAGPRHSGKSQFTNKLILQNNSLFSSKVDRFIWFYSGILQTDLQRELPHVKFINNLPEYNLEESFFGQTSTLIVIDDLMQEASTRDDVKALFARGRHRNINVIFFITEPIS